MTIELFLPMAILDYWIAFNEKKKELFMHIFFCSSTPTGTLYTMGRPGSKLRAEDPVECLGPKVTTSPSGMSL